MKHRIRKAKNEHGPDFYFLEAEPDFWLEIAPPANEDASDITAEAIKATLQLLAADRECPPGVAERGPIGYASRAFEIGLIKDWREVATVEVE